MVETMKKKKNKGAASRHLIRSLACHTHLSSGRAARIVHGISSSQRQTNHPELRDGKPKKVDDVTMAVRVSSFGFFLVAARAAGKPSPHQCGAAPQG